MASIQRSCDHCGVGYTATRSSSRYCTHACRSAARRERRRVVPEPEAAPAQAEPPPGEPRRTAVEQMLRNELDAAGRTDTFDGQAALALAIRLDERLDSGSGLSSLVAALRIARELALTGVATPAEDEQPATGDPIINLQERREQRRGTR